jgi:uncharacterized protein (DUF2147 family)
MKNRYSKNLFCSTGTIVALCVAIGFSFSSTAYAEVSADDILGRYWLPNRSGEVELYRQGELYFGRVVAFQEPDAMDRNNRDPQLRERPIVGMEMLTKFRFSPGDARWVEGTIYDGNSGRTYACELWFKDGNREVLWARGFIGISFFGHTEPLERVSPEPRDGAPLGI